MSANRRGETRGVDPYRTMPFIAESKKNNIILRQLSKVAEYMDTKNPQIPPIQRIFASTIQQMLQEGRCDHVRLLGDVKDHVYPHVVSHMPDDKDKELMLDLLRSMIDSLEKIVAKNNQ